MAAAEDIFVGGASFTTVPALNATVILWDSTAQGAIAASLTTTVTTGAPRKVFPAIKRGLLRVYADQIVTVFVDSLTAGSSTWRPNSAGSATTANTYFEIDLLFTSDDNRVRIAVTTAPTVWEVSLRLSTDRVVPGGTTIP